MTQTSSSRCLLPAPCGADWRRARGCAVISLVLSTHGCAFEVAEGPELEVGAVGTYRQPVVYSCDDRVEVFEHPLQEARSFAQSSSIALVLRERIHPGSGSEARFEATSLTDSMHLCAGERYGDQPDLAMCSGVLIDDDLVLTAGHCLGNSGSAIDLRCQQLAVVPGFHYVAAGQLAPLAVSSIRVCHLVLVHVHSQDDPLAPDYAILKLDSPMPEGFAPARFAAHPEQLGDKLHLIGNGLGLPTKIDSGGQVREVPVDSEYFRADTDSFAGGSGSPVLSDSLRLLGIQIRGQADLIAIDGCNSARVVQDGFELHQKAEHAREALCLTGWPSSRLCDTAAVCGDRVCSGAETSSNCATDCVPSGCGDGLCQFIEEDRCDEDCGYLKGIRETIAAVPHRRSSCSITSPGMPSGGPVAAIGVFGALAWLRRRQRAGHQQEAVGGQAGTSLGYAFTGVGHNRRRASDRNCSMFH